MLAAERRPAPGKEGGIPVSPRHSNESPMSGLEAAALLGRVGLTVAVPPVLGALAGRLVTAALGGGGLVMTVFILLGLAGGLYGAFRLLLRELR